MNDIQYGQKTGGLTWPGRAVWRDISAEETRGGPERGWLSRGPRLEPCSSRSERRVRHSRGCLCLD